MWAIAQKDQGIIGPGYGPQPLWALVLLPIRGKKCLSTEQAGKIELRPRWKGHLITLSKNVNNKEEIKRKTYWKKKNHEQKRTGSRKTILEVKNIKIAI